MVQNRLHALTPNEAVGAVDLNAIDCRGCRHLSFTGNVCRRYPPVFQPSTAVQQAGGEVQLAQGGWTFPPAVQRCGEWSTATT